MSRINFVRLFSALVLVFGASSAFSTSTITYEVGTCMPGLPSFSEYFRQLFLRKHLPGADVNDPRIRQRVLDERRGTVALTFDFRVGQSEYPTRRS